MADVAALGLKIDGISNIDAATASLDKFATAGGKADQSTKKLGDESSKAKPKIDAAGKSGESAGKGFSSMAAAAQKAGLIIGAFAAATALKNYADQWSDMQSVVGAATGDMQNAGVMMGRLVDIANASYSSLGQTVDVYSRNVVVLSDLGKSAQEAANFTESLNHMLVLTATRGERAASVQNALSKAMAVGKLQADGLETILANGGEVAQALAAELGTTVSGLRKLAGEGKITGEVIANAIINPLDDVSDRAAEMPATLSDAFTRIQNNLTEFVGRFDKASGASSALADVILRLADGIRTAGDFMVTFGQLVAPVFTAIGTIAEYADLAVIALAGFYAPALLAGIASTTVALGVGLVGAVKAVTAAMLANPIGFIIGALAAAGYAAYKFRDEIKEAIGVDVVDVIKSAANYLINSFDAAYEDIKFVWNNFGNMMGAAVIGGVNIAIREINGFVSSTLSGINSLIKTLNDIPGVNIGLLGASDAIKEIANPYLGKLTEAVEERNRKIAEIMTRDTVGGWFSSPEGSAAPDAPGGGGSGGGGAGGALSKQAAQAIEQNAKAIESLGTSLYMAGLEGEALAVAQARMSLNEYATQEQIDQVDALARAIYQINEAERARKEFGTGNDADKFILGDTDPLSGGMFDEQVARYEAEAEAERVRYQEQLDRLAEARELQIETNRSYDELEYIAAQDHANRMAQIDQARTTTMLNTFGNAFGGIASILKNSQGEQSTIYRAMFAASKAFSVASATISAYDAISKAWNSAPFPANLAAVAATAPQVMAVVSSISGTSLSGMAHDGIDSIPKTGTWLLEQGERVTTADTSAKLDATLERVDSQLRNGRSAGSAPMQAPVINLIEDASRAGQTEVVQNDGERYSANIFISNIMSGGSEAETLESVYGLQRAGT